MVDVSSQNNSVSINVLSSGNSASIKASPDTAQYYSEKSREYATSDKLIDGKDYSSKYYANKSAISESNAKGYAQSSQDTYNQFQQSVEGALSNVDIAVQGAVESVTDIKNQAVDEIGTNKTTAITEINSTKTTALNSINISKNEALDQISNTGINEKVNKTGDTMTGNLRLNNASLNITSGAIYTRNTTYALDDIASTAKYEIIVQHEDKNNVRKSRLESAWLTDGSHLTALSEKKSASENSYASVQVGWDKNGKAYATAPTPATGDNSTNIATTAFVNTVVPAGTIVSSGRSSTPTGYLYCNGSAVSRTTYANLFNAIGTTYGTGDGSTTFNLPNFTTYKFVTSGTVSVKGNGKAIGITDGTNNYGLGSGTAFLTAPRTQNYGQNVGVSLGATAKNFDSTIGLTTDASKSGITATASTATIKWYIKY